MKNNATLINYNYLAYRPEHALYMACCNKVLDTNLYKLCAFHHVLANNKQISYKISSRQKPSNSNWTQLSQLCEHVLVGEGITELCIEYLYTRTPRKHFNRLRQRLTYNAYDAIFVLTRLVLCFQCGRTFKHTISQIIREHMNSHSIPF